MRCFKSLSCGLLFLGAIIAAAMPASAADFRLRRAPQSAAVPAPAQQPGHVTYIRRLMRDANAAASRGDDAAARRLAERAHKIAVTYQSSLAGSPDCTPEATAELVQKFGSTTGSPPKKSSAEPSAVAPPRALAKSQAQELDILSMADPKHRAQKTPAANTSEPAAAAKTPTLENRLVSTSPARQQQAKPAAQTNKSNASKKQQRPSVQAAPAKSSRSVARATPQSSEASRQENRSDERQQTVSRSVDAERSTRTVAKSQAKLPRSSARPTPQPIADPEVQSAIGDADANDWEVDLNAAEDAEDTPTESQLPPAPPAEEISRTRSARAADDPTIGVWSSGNETHSGVAARKQAVSLPDFLSPEISPASRDVDAASRDRGTQLIETDFRRPVHSESPRPALQVTATHSGPAIRVREEPAVQWPDAAARTSAGKVSKAEPLPLGLALPAGASERLVLVIGVALLIGGFALFGLSFRQT